MIVSEEYKINGISFISIKSDAGLYIRLIDTVGRSAIYAEAMMPAQVVPLYRIEETDMTLLRCPDDPYPCRYNDHCRTNPMLIDEMLESYEL